MWPMRSNVLLALAATEPDDVELESWVVIDPLAVALLGAAVVLLVVVVGVLAVRLRRRRVDAARPSGDEPGG